MPRDWAGASILIPLMAEDAALRKLFIEEGSTVEYYLIKFRNMSILISAF